MKHFTSLLFLALIAILTFFLVLIINPIKSRNSKPIEIGFCGTTDVFIGGSATGKKLFKYNCASCHAKNMVSNATGPALAGTLKFWKSDTLSLINYLNDSELFFKTTKNERIIAVRKEYQPTQSHNFSLNSEEIKLIFEYIQMIY